MKKTRCYPPSYRTITNFEELPLFLTKQDVANLFKVTPGTIRRWELEGAIKTVKIGSSTRFYKDDIKQLLEGEQC